MQKVAAAPKTGVARKYGGSAFSSSGHMRRARARDAGQGADLDDNVRQPLAGKLGRMD